MTTTTSSTATPSPTCAVHSTTVPSVMESPMRTARFHVYDRERRLLRFLGEGERELPGGVAHSNGPCGAKDAHARAGPRKSMLLQGDAAAEGQPTA